MPSVLQSTFLFIGVAFVGVLWQLTLRELIFDTLGVGRVMQPLSDFPYSCRRLYHPLLEGCEDMWLDDEKRVMYAACGETKSRLAWLPSGDVFNLSARGPSGQVAMLDIDRPGTDGLFGVRAMSTKGYVGALGGADKDLDLHGFDVEILGKDTLRFWLINHRPSVGPDGAPLDAAKVGQNSTIEVFESRRGGEATVLRHVRTVADYDALVSLNKVAATGDGGLVVTNDHSGRPGWRRSLDNILGGGSVASCKSAADPKSAPKCRIAASTGLNLPNGVVRGRDGLYYVPTTGGDKHSVMRLRPDGSLELVTTFSIGMPIDNLAVDANGDIWAAAFPKLAKVIPALFDPSASAPAAVFKISRVGGWDAHAAHEKPEYQVTKVLEDDTGAIISATTVARHDVKTGRIFLGTVVAPYAVVCDPVKK